MRERLERARAVIRRGMCHKGDTLNACSYCQEKLAALQGLDEIEEYVPNQKIDLSQYCRCLDPSQYGHSHNCPLVGLT